jgi:diguanylate cyclase (GGDEF)-like protein
LQRYIGASVERHELMALMFIDLDNFKTVNDKHGHDAGDEVLCEVARRMTSVVRSRDVLCRLGGDEFALILPELPDEAAAEQMAQRLIDAVRVTMTIRGQIMPIGATVGLAFAPVDANDPAALLNAQTVPCTRPSGLARTVTGGRCVRPRSALLLWAACLSTAALAQQQPASLEDLLRQTPTDVTRDVEESTSSRCAEQFAGAVRHLRRHGYGHRTLWHAQYGRYPAQHAGVVRHCRRQLHIRGRPWPGPAWRFQCAPAVPDRRHARQREHLRCGPAGQRVLCRRRFDRPC